MVARRIGIRNHPQIARVRFAAAVATFSPRPYRKPNNRSGIGHRYGIGNHPNSPPGFAALTHRPEIPAESGARIEYRGITGGDQQVGAEIRRRQCMHRGGYRHPVVWTKCPGLHIVRGVHRDDGREVGSAGFDHGSSWCRRPTHRISGAGGQQHLAESANRTAGDDRINTDQIDLCQDRYEVAQATAAARLRVVT